MLLTEDDKRAIADAIQRAELQTSGEIVFAVADASGRYRHAAFEAALLGMAAVTAIYVALPGTHTIGILLWTELVSLVFFYALVPHLPWRRYLIPGSEMEERVQEAAFREFYASGLYKTHESNGVLIYLSCLERRVVVLGDKGIHEKMGTPHWEEVRDKIINGIREGKARGGICAGVEICAKALGQHFPRRPDDVNELPDEVIDRTSDHR